MSSNLMYIMNSLSLNKRKNGHEDTFQESDDEEIERNLLLLNALSQAGRSDSDDYDDDDEDDDEFLARTKKFKKLQKMSSVFFKSEKIKKNPSRFIRNYFDETRKQIDTCAQTAVSLARKQGNSGKKVKKLKARQIEMHNEISDVEQKCIRNLRSKENDIKSLAVKIYDLLEEAPDFGKKDMDMLVDELVDVPKEFSKLMCQLFVGTKVSYEKSKGPDADKKLGVLNSSCSFNYKKISANDGTTQIPVEKTQAELIFYYEVRIS